MKINCAAPTQKIRRATIFAVLGILFNLIMLISPPVNARGAEIDRDEKARERGEDLDFLYSTLKEVHPDLFAGTEEALFLAKKKELAGRINTVNDFTFALDLQSLVALAGDSHTTVSLNYSGSHLYPFSIEYYNGQAVLVMAPKTNPELLGQKVIAINNFPLELVYERFTEIISHDNEIKLRRQFKQMVVIAEVLEYCGFSEPSGELTLTVSDAQGKESKITLPPVEMSMTQSVAADYVFLDNTRKEMPVTEFNRGKIYFTEPLSDSVYYIQYNQCREDPNLPMANFCVQAADDLQAAAYNKIIVDLRYNGGGGDGVLVPLLTLLAEVRRKDNVKLFCLVDEMTFSSATTNAMMMKDMGAVIVGAPTSGSVDHFGSTNRFTLPNSGINVVYSTKLIDVADYLECGHGYDIETLVPDYDAAQTLDDYLNGIDTSVQYVLEHGDSLEPPKNDDAMLTRGSFAALLYQKAKERGKGGENGSAPFMDIFPFARNTQAVEWVINAGVMDAINGERFAPAHLITREEIAATLARFAEYLDETPQARGAENPGFEPGENMSRQQAQELIDSLFP